MTQSNPTLEHAQPDAILLADYRVPDFLIDDVKLRFCLNEGSTTVHAKLTIRRNPASDESDAALRLDGQHLELVSASLDSQQLESEEYQVDADSLTIHKVPDSFLLTTEVRIEPEKNTALEGLYKSGDFYCTQCEAEGFRRITYFLDRPDVLARFTTTVEGDKKNHPVLLSNGNPIDRGDSGENRHFVTWEDPHCKPCYLFALVAGDLEHIEDHYLTSDGRDVTLQIYTTKNNIDKCDHAMRSLKKSMQWDEDVYGLACDLDYYMIVVTDDFNMGAMENKGLNIFNSKYVLARPDTASDHDFAAIEGVIAHEYFHNWTGNRVTCRDWFQLSLKEGLTVFRDQNFSGDMNSPAIQRIGDVRTLRTAQFPEDRGPMSHPIRPPSVIEINNFYTVTVYEKGAEVVRMYHTLLGSDGFRKGMDLYFERFDGQAVTCDDFRQAMADANQRDLSQFANWYSQSGTPTVRATTNYDPDAQSFKITLEQDCPSSKTLANDQPFHIPFAVGLLDGEGKDQALHLANDSEVHEPALTTRVLELTEPKQTFEFIKVKTEPLPSMLRDFSAPVILNYEYQPSQLAFLMAHDSDPFSRWDASQQLMLQCLQQNISEYQANRPLHLSAEVIQAFQKTLSRRADDPALTAELLALPNESFVGDQMEIIDVNAVHEVRTFARKTLAEALRTEFLTTYRECVRDTVYSTDAKEIARRSLQNTSLSYLMTLQDPEVHALCTKQYETANNMTEVAVALACLCHHETPGYQEALASFYDKWKNDALVIDKWLSIQSTSPATSTLENVQSLMQHKSFSIQNPNKVRSLIGGFCAQNRINFHAADGRGYAFLGDQILTLDALNPQIAARMASIFNHWRRFDSERQLLMQTQLQRIVKQDGLSPDVFEIASKALA
jgi:aminopeptidase N